MAMRGTTNEKASLVKAGFVSNSVNSMNKRPRVSSQETTTNLCGVVVCSYGQY